MLAATPLAIKMAGMNADNKQDTQDPGASLSYRDAGVDIDAGNALVERIKPLARSTERAGVAGGLGGFGGLFDLKAAGYTDPILVSATDGVGTKLRLAIEHDRHDAVGVDLVAMCVNDLICQGAEPLFFLDYFATGALDVETAARVVAGIAEGCRQAHCALIGGETAEMPGMYGTGDYDLAGFAVGAVERDGVIDGRSILAGDRLIGLASSGCHSNGYSLVRRVLAREAAPETVRLDGLPLMDALMMPTRIYVMSVLPCLHAGLVKGLAHITGGGFTENIPRILPKGLGCEIDSAGWRVPEVFEWLARTGNIAPAEMRRTFNLGIGMVLAVAPGDVGRTLDMLDEQGEHAVEIGEVVAGEGVVFLGE